MEQTIHRINGYMDIHTITLATMQITVAKNIRNESKYLTWIYDLATNDFIDITSSSNRHSAFTDFYKKVFDISKDIYDLYITPYEDLKRYQKVERF